MSNGRSLVMGVLGALLVVAVTVPADAQVRVGVNIGFQLPGPPALVVVPGAPVYYAPRAPANVFFYAHQYWAFANGGWYVGPGWSGPWAVVEPAYVPVPILQVAVRYYPAPPPGWKGWRREAPPQWSAHYGVSGAKKPASEAGVSTSNLGLGAVVKAARRGSPSRDAASPRAWWQAPCCTHCRRRTLSMCAK